MDIDGTPLVSVGLFVRNGAKTLSYVLDAITQQSYQRLEIILANNASDDETLTIAETYASKDARMRVLHHTTPVSMLRNMESTFREATGKYFLLASDNDVPSQDYIATLVAVLEADEGVGLAYGDVFMFESYDNVTSGGTWLDVACNTRGMAQWRRLLSGFGGGYPTYGLWRSAYLRDYTWWDHTVSPDFPLMAYAAMRADIVQVQAAKFYMPKPPTLKTGEQRAILQSYAGIESFAAIRLCWRCAQASSQAARSRGSHRVVVWDFLLLVPWLLWSNRVRRPWNDFVHRKHT